MEKPIKKIMIEIPAYEISFECDESINVEHFVKIKETPNFLTNTIVREPFGGGVLLITNGLPNNVLTEIRGLIKNYCNH